MYCCCVPHSISLLTCEPHKVQNTPRSPTVRTILLVYCKRSPVLLVVFSRPGGTGHARRKYWGALILRTAPHRSFFVAFACWVFSIHAMQLLLLAVSVAASAPVLGEAFVAANGKISATVSPFSRQTALLSTCQQQRKHMTMAAAIVGGGRIGSALYVSMTSRAML